MVRLSGPRPKPAQAVTLGFFLRRRVEWRLRKSTPSMLANFLSLSTYRELVSMKRGLRTLMIVSVLASLLPVLLLCAGVGVFAVDWVIRSNFSWGKEGDGGTWIHIVTKPRRFSP